MKTFAEFIGEKQILGLHERITIQHLGNVKAKVDTGNGGFNVIHGVNLQEKDGKVTFNTVENKKLTLPVADHVVINIGSGNKEHRPVVKLDCSIGTEQFNQVPFSIADRTENDCPVLLSKDFIKLNGGVVNVNINDTPETQSP
jgi:hypothetical protein